MISIILNPDIDLVKFGKKFKDKLKVRKHAGTRYQNLHTQEITFIIQPEFQKEIKENLGEVCLEHAKILVREVNVQTWPHNNTSPRNATKIINKIIKKAENPSIDVLVANEIAKDTDFKVKIHRHGYHYDRYTYISISNYSKWEGFPVSLQIDESNSNVSIIPKSQYNQTVSFSLADPKLYEKLLEAIPTVIQHCYFFNRVRNNFKHSGSLSIESLKKINKILEKDPGFKHKTGS